MISIIVPVFKAERTISRCIDSVIAQKYQDWELILVDDGSPDNSREICNYYALNDSRIQVFHQSNKGVSSARNMGLSLSKGDSICFVDSDDYVGPLYLFEMAEAAKCNNSEIVIQGLSEVDNNGNIINDEHFDSQCILVEDVYDSLLDQLLRHNGPYCKLFRLSIIKEFHLQFPEHLCYGEDRIFYCEYLLHCKSISFLSCQEYYYSANVVGSLSAKTHNPEMLWSLYSTQYLLFDRLHTVFTGAAKYSEEDWEKMCNIKSLLKSMYSHRIGCRKAERLLALVSQNEYFAFSNVHPIAFSDKLLKAFVMLFKCHSSEQ